jgi:hypothetical protein
LSVEALVDAAAFEQLTRGEPQTMDVRVRAPEWLTYAGNVAVMPPKVTLSFTIRKRQADITLAVVPVQVADMADDRAKYSVEINPTSLKDVTVTAESDLVRRIASGEVAVVAVMHLSARDKADHINSKAISYFIALIPDDNGASEGTLVKGQLGASTEAPMIQVRITDR